MNAYLENSNYWNDSRVIAGMQGRWYARVDQRTMLASVKVPDSDGNEHTGTIHFRFDVCPTCRGKGSHVNPSIDAHGLSREDLYGDPDFAESYFRGDYDQPCYECQGARVVPVPDPRDARERYLLELIQKEAREEAEHQAMVRAERMMGA